MVGASTHQPQGRGGAGSSSSSSSSPPPLVQTTGNAQHGTESTVSSAGAKPESPPKVVKGGVKPSHRFKVVLLGDAAVGKTALRQRWIHNQQSRVEDQRLGGNQDAEPDEEDATISIKGKMGFSLSYRATIGVDFISKNIDLSKGLSRGKNGKLDTTQVGNRVKLSDGVLIDDDDEGDRDGDYADEVVSLSVWDTAGQERFRSLASSFFRGSDACILCYSSESRESFDSIKTWFEEFRDKAPVDDVNGFTWVAVRTKVDLEDEAGQGRIAGFEDGEEERLLDSLLGRDSSKTKRKKKIQEGQVIKGYRCHDEEDVDREHEEMPRQSVADDLIPSSKAKERQAKIDHRLSNGDADTCCDDMPTTIQILPSADAHQHNHQPRSSRHVDLTDSASRRMRASTSTRTFQSIYHTPSSSFHDSLDSLAAPTSSSPVSDSGDTITANHNLGAEFRPEPHRTLTEQSTSSTLSAPYSDDSCTSFAPPTELDSAETERELVARGIDAYMSTSPPHAPPHLLTRGKYLGGPSLFQKIEQADLEEIERKRLERKRFDQIPGGETEGKLKGARRWEKTRDYAEEDGIKLFKTSAKTGEGVDEVFDYVARRCTWKWHRDERLHKAHREEEEGLHVIRLGPQKTGSKWREACCS